MKTVLLACIVLLPNVVHAAYQNPTVSSYEREPNGTGKLIMQFAGNAGEPVVVRAYSVTASSTFAGLRNWVDRTIAELDLTHTAASLPQLQPGQTINRLAPTPSSLSAKSAWKMKVQIYDQACKSSLTGSVATDCATLKSDIESTYQSGFLNAD